LAFLLLSARATGQTTTQPSTWTGPASRQAFANQFAKIKKGMTAGEVASILGKPDDVCIDFDHVYPVANDTDEIWAYGTDHHRGFPTLGTVYIDYQGKVQDLAGTTGAADVVSKLGETELRRLLRLLFQAGRKSFSTGRFEPRATIVAVNALQPAGKEAGIGVLHEFFQLFPSAGIGSSGIFGVVLASFEAQPPAQTFWHDLSWFPEDTAPFPVFPLCIVDDVPLAIGNEGPTAGAPISAAAVLDSRAKIAAWRTKPLAPTNNPTSVLAELDSLLSPRLQQTVQTDVERQILRLVDTVFQYDPDDLDSADAIDTDFRAASRQFRTAQIHWDARRECYVAGDGATFPPNDPAGYPLTVYAPPIPGGPGYRVRIALERRGSKSIGIEITRFSDGRDPPVRVRVASMSQPPRSLYTTTVTPFGGAATVQGSFVLSPGQGVQIQVSTDDGSWTSPTYKP
jgi:hypothetical protein